MSISYSLFFLQDVSNLAASTAMMAIPVRQMLAFLEVANISNSMALSRDVLARADAQNTDAVSVNAFPQGYLNAVAMVYASQRKVMHHVPLIVQQLVWTA